MDFRLKEKENLTDGIIRVGQGLNRQAISHIDELSPDNPHEAIHEIRKRFKELRALIRMVRDALGEENYKNENVFYRDLAREVSELRDTKAFMETLNDIKKEYEDKLYKKAFSATESYLQERLTTLEEEIEINKLFGSIKERLEDHEKNIEMWPIDIQEFDDLSKGIKRTYKRGYKMREKVKDEPTSTNFHEWRKRAKYSRYHMDIMRFLWPDMMEAQEDGFHDLTDAIGDDHDLAELLHLLDRENADSEDFKIIRAIANDKRALFQEQALRLGDKIYYEKPKDFVKRLGEYISAHERSYTNLNTIPQ